jgi:ribonuclease E
VRERAPVSFGTESSLPAAPPEPAYAPPAPPAPAVETPQPIVSSPTAGEEQAQPRRSGWWSRRVLGKG